MRAFGSRPSERQHAPQAQACLKRHGPSRAMQREVYIGVPDGNLGLLVHSQAGSAHPHRRRNVSVASGMRAALRSGGKLLIQALNWEQLRKEKARFTQFQWRERAPRSGVCPSTFGTVRKDSMTLTRSNCSSSLILTERFPRGHTRSSIIHFASKS